MTSHGAVRVAVLGATGLVGREMLRVLEQRAFPVAELTALASARSAGTTVPFAGSDVTVREAAPESFEGVDLVLASAGASVSKRLLPEAARRGAVSIDNSSAYRMEPDVPLVVPEVNGHRIADCRADGSRGIIANPNCSTIQLVVALAPLAREAGLRRVVVSTYQGVSGAGQAAVAKLRDDTRRGLDETDGADPKAVAFNARPEIDVFVDGGETREEWKMRVETAKILELDVPLTATCVRVPVEIGHSEAVWIETERPLTPERAREILRDAPGVTLWDDPADPRKLPTALDAAGTDPVHVGRIRRDPSIENGLALWVVADNLRKGAALNAVQIAEGWLDSGSTTEGRT